MTAVTSISTSLGLGSGIDTTQLVTDLTAAAKAPKEKQIAAKEAANKAKVSAVADAAGGIDRFASALNALISGGSLFTQPSTTDADKLGVTALPGSRLAGLSAQVEIRALAKGQSIISNTAVDRDATFGAGTFKIKDGAGIETTVTVDANDSTLAGIARAINTADSGVTASIVTSGTSQKLVMKGKTGAANSFTVEADGNFAPLAYGSGSTGMVSTQAAQDAVVRVDGVESTRPTNSINDLISGVQLELKKVTGTDGVAVGNIPPTSAIRTAVQDFAAAYNELKKTLDGLTANGVGGAAAGPLRGNLGLREMQRQLAKLSSTDLSSGGSPSTLAELGVKTERDGTLSVDTTTLDKMLAEQPDKVEAMFNPTQRSSSPLVQITSAMGKTKPGTYEITDIQIGPPLKANINGKAGYSLAGTLYASGVTDAAGLSFTVKPGVTSATITVDPGLGGALTAIRDLMNKDVANEENDGALTRLKDSYTKEAARIAAERTKMETDSDTYKAKLTKSYTDMEKRVTALNATRAYMTQQVAQWNKSD
jgi:flagellar hook-associated protein 2